MRLWAEEEKQGTIEVLLTLPVHDGRVEHGTWQQIVLCDYDNRPRRRRIVIEVLGP